MRHVTHIGLGFAAAAAAAAVLSGCGGDGDGAATPTATPPPAMTNAVRENAATEVAPTEAATTEEHSGHDDAATTEDADGRSTEEATDGDGGDDGATRFAVRVEGGMPVGGVQKLAVSSGEHVVLEVTSDTEAAVHVHGYDLLERVPAGGTVRFEFEAEFEGIFEVEVHADHAEPIAELRVEP